MDIFQYEYNKHGEALLSIIPQATIHMDLVRELTHYGSFTISGETFYRMIFSKYLYISPAVEVGNPASLNKKNFLY